MSNNLKPRKRHYDSPGDLIARLRAGSPSFHAISPICSICNKPRGKSYNHAKCSRIRQARFAKEREREHHAQQIHGRNISEE